MAGVRDIAFEIKEKVSCRAFAEGVMGIKPDQKGFAVCPFHGDRDASFKIYDGGGRGWTCFGCHRGGDVINLAREWYGVGFQEALKNIDRDFALKLCDNAGKARTADDTAALRRLISEKKRKDAEKEALNAENEYLDALDEWLRWRNIARALSPRRNGGETLKGYAIALKRQQETEIRLDQAEGRRDRLCRKLRQATS